MTAPPSAEEVPNAPGFYWVLITFDPDAEAEWVNSEQPAYWDGTRWHLIGCESDWPIRWFGEEISLPRNHLIGDPR